MTARTTTGRRGDAGFTLIEMVIVIGIIVLLAGLTLAVSVAVTRGAEVRQTENTIRLLESALREWEAQADRKVTYGIDDEPFGAVYEIPEPESSPPTPDEMALTSARLMTILGRNAAARETLARIGPDFIDRIADDDVPDLEHMLIRDAWGEPIIAVFPGREWFLPDDDGDPRDADGTIRTSVEYQCGAAVNRQICFVSAGPDGRFGNLDEDSAEHDPESARDNVLSYPLQVREEP